MVFYRFLSINSNSSEVKPFVNVTYTLGWVGVRVRVGVRVG